MKKILLGVLFFAYLQTSFGQLRVDASSQLHIGGTSPTERLDVNGAIRIGTTANSNAGTIRYLSNIFEGYNGTAWVDLTSQNIWNQSGGTVYYTGGSVGIGTASPLATFHAEGTTNEAFRFKNTISTNFSRSQFLNNIDDGLIITTYGSAYVSGTTGPVGQNGTVVAGSKITAMGSMDSTLMLLAGGNAKLYLLESGNFGVGVGNPLEKIQIGIEGDWLRIGEKRALKQSYFGRSGLTYKTIQIADFSTTTDNISLGADITANTSTDFAGKNIVIPNNSKMITPNNANNGYVGILRIGTDDKLYLGGGGASSTEQITINNATGKIGIGADALYETVELKGRVIISDGGGASRKVMLFENSTTFNRIESYDYGAGAGMDLVLNAAVGKVGIGTTTPAEKLDVNGNARIRLIGSGTSSGALHYTNDGTLTTNTSDIRLKKNIKTLKNPLKKIQKLRGVKYNWKDENNPTRQIGLIAQEVETEFSELVFTNPVDGFKGVHYDKIVAVLIEGMKAQQKQIEALQKDIKKLKKRK